MSKKALMLMGTVRMIIHGTGLSEDWLDDLQSNLQKGSITSDDGVLLLRGFINGLLVAGSIDPEDRDDFMELANGLL